MEGDHQGITLFEFPVELLIGRAVSGRQGDGNVQLIQLDFLSRIEPQKELSPDRARPTFYRFGSDLRGEIDQSGR